jgi:hypothetical protein
VNGKLKRLVALTLAGMGMVAVTAVTAGSAGADARGQASPRTVTVTFVVRGDLKWFDGRLHDFNCVERTQPNPFRVRPFEHVRVDVESFDPFVCTKNEAIWLLVTQPKSANDPPETMGVRLRYGERPTTVDFLHTSRDLRWVAHVLDSTHVEVEITGR